MRTTSSSSRSSATAAGTSSLKVDQRSKGGQWVLLGDFNFDPTKSPPMITIRTVATKGFVVADAVQLVETDFDPLLSQFHKGMKRNPIKFRNTLQIKSAIAAASSGAKVPSDDLHSTTRPVKNGTFGSRRMIEELG